MTAGRGKICLLYKLLFSSQNLAKNSTSIYVYLLYSVSKKIGNPDLISNLWKTKIYKDHKTNNREW